MNTKHLNILLADDDEDDCMFFQNAVEELPLKTTVMTVRDGEQLMHLLWHVDPKPDVLFLDLNMPRKNGLECLEEIKLHPTLQNLPVVIFSTSNEPEVSGKLSDKGARHFICKPADFASLKSAIHAALQLIMDPPDKATGGEVFMLSGHRDAYRISAAI